jgi:drug/metabolite transporter (DMT)-like permease
MLRHQVKFMAKNSVLGTALILVMVVIGSIQDVYLGSLFQREHPLVVMTVSFGITLAFFLALQIGRSSEFKRGLRDHFRSVTGYNVSTVLSWMGLFYSLEKLEPAVAGTVCFTLGPILTAIFWKQLRPDKPLHNAEKWASVGITAGLLITLFGSQIGKSGIGEISAHDFNTGLLAAAISAIGVVGNTIFSKRLSDAKLPSDAIMALRFPLVLVVGLACLPFTDGIQSPVMTFSVTMTLFALLTIIAPLYILQKGIEHSEPITVSLLLTTIPIVTYFFQFLDSRVQPSAYTLVGAFICVGFSAWGVSDRLRREQRAKIERKVPTAEIYGAAPRKLKLVEREPKSESVV